MHCLLTACLTRQDAWTRMTRRRLCSLYACAFVHAGALFVCVSVCAAASICFEDWGVVDLGLKTGVSWVLKVPQTEARSTGFRVSYLEFYLKILCTNLSISEKSPLWKVFSSHNSVHTSFKSFRLKYKKFCLEYAYYHLNNGPSIKYVTLFYDNFYPPPLSHFVTHPRPPKVRHTFQDPPPDF